MEGSRVEEALPFVSRPQTNMQSIDDFVKEEEELETKRLSDAASFRGGNLTTKELKASLQAERERVEAEKKLRKASIQVERERLENEKVLAKAAIEAEQLRLEEQEYNLVEEMGVQNWVGTLLEYRAANPKPDAGPIYTEEVVPLVQPRFRCKVTIPESPYPFGGPHSFSNKKDAKKYASKKAVDWLIGNGFMPDDGSVRFPTSGTPAVVETTGGTTQSPTGSPKPASGTSYAGQIPALCQSLGLTPPTYKLTKDLEDAAFWSGYADFGGHPLIKGKVGEVRSVFGKKDAKEQIATGVFRRLKKIERQRIGG